MTMYWGAWSKGTDGDDDTMRVGVDITFSAVSHTSTSCTATYKIYTENGTTFGDDKEKLEFDGNYSLPEEHDFTNSGTIGSTYRTTRTYTWNYSSTSYGVSPAEADLRVDVLNVYHGMKPYVVIAVPFPARPYSTPAIPTPCVVSRSNDEQNSVSWTRRPTTGEPYTAIWLERYIYNYATWARIATLGATVSSFLDTGAIPNRKYAYRVQADNTVGTSGYAQSGNIFTAPATPGAPLRTDGTAGAQTLTWTLAVGYTEYATEIWRAVGGTYALLATVAAGVTTYTDTTASAALKNKYKFRTKTTTGTVLYSAYSVETTETTGIPTAPAAPTGLKPSTGTIDPTAPYTFTWTHVPTDGSLQTFYEVQYRHVGSSSWIMPANSVSKGEQVEWQVRTWGYSSTLAGAWSASAKWMTTPLIPPRYPLFLDVNTGITEADSNVKLITEQTRRVATVSRITTITNQTAIFNVLSYTLPAALTRTGKKFRITAQTSLVPDTAGMYSDLRLYIGVGALTTGTMIGSAYSDHRIVNRAVSAMVVAEYTFDPATAGGENLATINIAAAVAPGGGGVGCTLGTTRPAFLIIDEIIDGPSTAGGGGGSGVPPGGTDNQVLTKRSAVDGDAGWEDSQGGGGLAVVEPVYYSQRGHQGALSVPNLATTTVPFDTPIHTGNIEWNGSGWVIPVDGYYDVEAMVSYTPAANPSAGVRGAFILLNGAGQAQAVATPNAGSQVTTAAVSQTVKCLAGQVLSIGAYQTSGAALALSANHAYTRASITKVPELAPGGGGVIVERPVAVSRQQSAQTSFVHNTLQVVDWDTENYNDGIPFSAGVYTIPSDGYYQINAKVTWNNNAVGTRSVRVLVNGASTEGGIANFNSVNSTNGIAASISRTLKLKTGDLVMVQALQSSGGALTLAGAAYNTLDITKVPAAYAGSAVSTYGERNYAAFRKSAAAQSIPNATITTVLWEIEEVNDGITYDGAGGFTVPVSGYYDISAAVHLGTNTTSYRTIQIYVNGVQQALVQIGPSPSGGASPTISKSMLLTADDVVTIRVSQGTGAALSTAGGAPYGWVSITKVPAPVINGAAASGVWGVGNLTPAKVGANDLAGREIYIDSKGQLRAEPPEDTGWVNITVVAGFAAAVGAIPQVRRIGKTVYSRGGFGPTGINANGSHGVGIIPAGFLPPFGFYAPVGTSSGNVGGMAVIGAGAGDSIQIRAGATLSTNYFLSSTWLTD
jgi:hypothetical protein